MYIFNYGISAITKYNSRFIHLWFQVFIDNLPTRLCLYGMPYDDLG